MRAAQEGITPLEYMLRVMRDPIPETDEPLVKVHKLNQRFEAAKAAAPYVHPRLQSHEVSGKDGGPIEVSASWLSGRCVGST